ncbi:MAG: hypothetical protein R3B48_13625 [Kofleriaceae bacterium]
MSEDERALRERLAALESEVKASVDAERARKDAALELVRAERAARAARAAAEAAAKRPEPEAAASARPRKPAVDPDALGSALELARRAQDVKTELTKPAKRGDKSWKISAALSTALGPLGWLYAGSWREAAPAGAAWVAFLYVAQWILPSILLWPMLFVTMPLSGIAGGLYAVSHNRKGSRQRIFSEGKASKKLGDGRKGDGGKKE